jgi:hypothetical protein
MRTFCPRSTLTRRLAVSTSSPVTRASTTTPANAAVVEAASVPEVAPALDEVAAVVAAAPPPSSSPPQPPSRQQAARTPPRANARGSTGSPSSSTVPPLVDKGRRSHRRDETDRPRPAVSARGFPDGGHGPTSWTAGIAVANVDSASVVHGEEEMTTMFSTPRAAAAAHRRANSSLDSPASRRVLSVFSIAS